VPRLVLASRSPRRAELLRSAGIDFTVSMSTDVDESWNKGETPVQYARRVARAKAESAAKNVDDALVLSADTTVWTHENAEPLGKPTDRDDARRMLTLLTRGRAHFVTTAYVLLDTNAPENASVAHETTAVSMRRLDADQVEDYLDTGEWHDKAGGYAIQGHAAGLVASLEGSYTNVVGLPLAQVLEALDELEESSPISGDTGA
jgi:septum formation protein